jgi:type II secretion system protein H
MWRRDRAIHEPKGFTLTELLLVISIIVLVGSVGGGIYVGTYKRLLAEKAARQFLLMARYARIMAIERQRPYELQLDPGGKGFGLTTTRVNTETGQNEKIIVKDLYCRPVEFEGDVTFEDIQIATQAVEQTDEGEQSQRILFLPNGAAESVIVQIGDGKSHYTIAVVAATGKARMYEGKADKVRMASVDLDVQ